MAPVAPVAVVTGATGFVASELVKQLLEKGYIVRGTVRTLHNESKVQHLQRLGKALPGQLTLHEANLLQVGVLTRLFEDINFSLDPVSELHVLQEGSFDAVIDGTTYLFHTAYAQDLPLLQKDGSIFCISIH